MKSGFTISPSGLEKWFKGVPEHEQMSEFERLRRSVSMSTWQDTNGKVYHMDDSINVMEVWNEVLRELARR